MSTLNISLVLVTGATGNQGGAVVRALLQAGRSVRALIRSSDSAAGQALAAQGVEVVQGDFDDRASLDAALAGVESVFSMQMPSPPDDPGSEIRHGKALMEAAYNAGVNVVVHTSVARAGEHKNFIGWDEGLWGPLSLYWQDKAAVNEMVKTQGFRHWVILKPALMMHNILPPVADSMFPALAKRGQLDSAHKPDTKIDWIAAQDIGAFAAAAFTNPERFHGHEITLAGDSVTMVELADKITNRTGKLVSAVTSSEEELVAQGYHPGAVRSQLWNNVEDYKVNLEAARGWGLPLITLDEFIEQHRDQFIIG